jgi:hypothetical protein
LRELKFRDGTLDLLEDMVIQAMVLVLLPMKKKFDWLTDIICVSTFSVPAPYQQLTTIPLQDMRGWITFSIDGKYAYPSSAEVIDVRTRKIITTLQDEFYNNVESEKMVEIDFENNKAARAGDQFGIGKVSNLEQ